MGVTRRAFLAGAASAAVGALVPGRDLLAATFPDGISLRTISPRQNELIEFGLVGVGPTGAGNPFSQPDVPAVFTGPDRRRLSTGAFWHESGEWRVRFLAEVPGRWTVSAAGASAQFDVAPSTTPGVIRRRGTMLRYPDGTPYLALGENVAWARSLATTEADYTEWYDRLRAVGATWSRLWMCSWAFGLEWSDTPLGDYRLRLPRAALLDRVLDLGANRGIRSQLVIQNHGAFSTQYNSEWDGNPYNAVNGGPLERPDQVWTDGRARNLFRRRIKYIVNRWWAHPGLLAWELWNEFDLVDINAGSRSAVAWHAEMAAYIRQLDPLRRPITTSRSLSLVADPTYDRVWDVPEIDFAQVHFYADTAAAASQRSDMTADLTVATTRLRRHGKPVIIGEADTGAAPATDDPSGEHLLDLAWGGLFASGTGSAMPWWWDSYVAPKNLYERFRGAFAFAHANRDVIAGASPRIGASGRLVVHHLKHAGRGAMWVRDATDHWRKPSQRSIHRGRVLVPTPQPTTVWFVEVPSGEPISTPVTLDANTPVTAVTLPEFFRSVALVYRSTP